MKIIKKVISKRKGQANIWVQNDEYERVQLFFHANTLVPVRDTLHFGIKPGHFFVYTKKWNEEGKWLIKDAGYINYFRVDQTSVIQTEYNTLSKSKLLSRGILTYKIQNSTIELNSYSLFPIHHRKLTLDLAFDTIIVKDRFLWKSNIFFNTNNGLLTDTEKFSNERHLILS
jgi:hypothetical protein